jgi:hypothetical protein
MVAWNGYDTGMKMPMARHALVDQTALNAPGTVGAFRHSLSVSLPHLEASRLTLEPIGEPDDRDTWTEIEAEGDGTLVLRVVLLTGDPVLSQDESGVMSGELAEAWMRATARAM